MESLDLTKTPPRSPRTEIDGLALLPRTIDKLRASLPGGNLGVYKMAGFSDTTLEAAGITHAQLLDVIAKAKGDQDVAAWFKAHAAVDKYNESVQRMLELKVEDVKARDPDGFVQRYPVCVKRPDLVYMADALAADDEEMFAKT